jgi:hypothetical protein
VASIMKTSVVFRLNCIYDFLNSIVFDFLQMHHEVESVDSDELHSGPPILSGSSDSSDLDCDDDEL